MFTLPRPKICTSKGPGLPICTSVSKAMGLHLRYSPKPIWAKPTSYHLHICTVQSRWIQPKKVYKKKIYVGASFFFFFFWDGAAACWGEKAYDFWAWVLSEESNPKTLAKRIVVWLLTRQSKVQTHAHTHKHSEKSRTKRIVPSRVWTD